MNVAKIPSRSTHDAIPAYNAAAKDFCLVPVHAYDKPCICRMPVKGWAPYQITYLH